jgi:starvation-inducible DNA-binding protein
MEVKENVFHMTHSGKKMQMGEKLGYLLADHFALYIKTLNCHWNVVDPRFHSLHEMFEEQYTQLAEQNDLIAERIRQLDIFVKGSLSEFSKKTSLDEIEKELHANEMIHSLIESYQQHCSNIKMVIADSEEEKDASTSDILVEILRSLEKNLWMLKSHL